MTNFWTPQKIKKGFEQFKNTHGRLPRAFEIDALEYLPSARYIQKRFGGLAYLRTELGYQQTHFGKGEFRSAIATNAGLRNKEMKQELERYLVQYFSVGKIQKEKHFYANYRVDFYINTDTTSFGIDIFYAKNIKTLQGSVNIKMKKYQYFPDPLYLTVANTEISQQSLDIYKSRKKISFPENIHLVTLESLHTTLKSIGN